MQWARQNGIAWVQKTFFAENVHLNTQIRGQSASLGSLWCQDWIERPENLLPFLPKPSPPAPSPSPAPGPPERQLTPSFYKEDGFDSDEYEDIWDQLAD